MTVRVVYMVEAYTKGGDLIARRFAATKRTAQKIAKKYDDVHTCKLKKNDWDCVDLGAVERF